MRFLMPIVSRYLSILAQFVIAAMVTNALPLDQAGVYFLISGTMLATYFAAGLGGPDGVVKVLPPLLEQGEMRQAAALLQRLNRVTLVSAAAMAVVFGLVWGMLRSDFALGAFCTAWWLGYGLVFAGAQNLVALGRVKIGAFVFYSSVNLGLFVLLVPVLARVKPVTLDLVLACCAAAALGAAGVTAALAHRAGPRARATELSAQIAPLWQAGRAIAAGRIVQSLLIWSPVLIAGALLGAEAAALIGLASRLVGAVSAIIAAIRFSIRPEVARHAAAGRWTEIQTSGARIAFWASLIVIAALLANIAVGAPLIAAIFGENYAPAMGLVALLLLGTLGESMGGPVDEILKMAGHSNQVFWAQCAALVLGAGLQAAMSQLWGNWGIAMGFSCAYIGLYLWMILRLHRLHGIFVFARFPKGGLGQ